MDIKPIYSEESTQMKNQLGQFICEHNLLSDIVKLFEKDDLAKQFFNEAREEVLESGNSGLNAMYVIAIEKIIEKARAYIENEWDETDIDKLNIKIWNLEHENRILKAKIEAIEGVLKGNQA